MRKILSTLLFGYLLGLSGHLSASSGSNAKNQNVIEVESPSSAALKQFAKERKLQIPVAILYIILQYAGEPPYFKFQDGVRTFKQMSVEDSRLIYRAELKKPSDTNKEPTYLKKILDARASEITTLIESKETGLDTRGEWIRHVHNILSVMYAITWTSWDAAWEAACVSGCGSGWDEAYDEASSTALRAAKTAARKAGKSAVSDTATIIKALDKTWDKAWEDGKEAVRAELSYSELTDLSEIAHSSYRTSEKVVLIYFLQNEKAIFDAAYIASNNNLLKPQNHIDSLEAWKKFWKTHFGKLTPEQYLFLRPYLQAIDWIVNNKIGLPN